AIAERLWSPATVTDMADMYRRLALVSARLDEAGLLHERNRGSMLRRLAGDNVDHAGREALKIFVSLIEPVKNYNRGKLQPNSVQGTPLTGLADCARPESDEARTFAAAVDQLLASPSRDPGLADAIQRKLESWAAAGHLAAIVLPVQAPRLREAAPLAQALEDSSRAGLEALTALRSGQKQADAWRTARLAVIDRAAEPNGSATELAVLAPLKRLVMAAAGP